LSGAFITIETGRLEKRGLVSKTQNPEDKRSVLVKLTRKGDALLAKLAPAQVEVNDTLFASLSRADFDRLNKMLAGMVRGSDDASAMLTYLSVKAASNN
jgi:DNA-binding MarR family transcriptional regulator